MSELRYSMKLTLKIIIALSCFVSSGCTQDDLTDTNSDVVPAMFNLNSDFVTGADLSQQKLAMETLLAPDNDGIVVEAVSIERWKVENIKRTKTSWPTNSGVVTWSSGDKVGVFMASSPDGAILSNNVQYNVASAGIKSSGLTPASTPIYFPNPKSQNVIFYGYYPYSASVNSTTLNYTLPANQTGVLGSADIMTATSSVYNAQNPNVTLPFNHRMALLSFSIKGAGLGLTGGTLTSITVSGTAVTNTGSINLATSQLTVNTTPQFSPTVTTNQAFSTSTTTYVDLIINPCQLSANNGSQLTVTLTATLTLLTIPLLNVTRTTNLATNASFVGGTRNVYAITINAL